MIGVEFIENKLLAMDLPMAAEGRDPLCFEVTVVAGMLHWGRLLTFDEVTSVRSVGDKLLTMRTLLHSVFPLTIAKLS